MRNFKRFMAVALAATMVVGSSLMVSAAASGGTEGTGTPEGHVDKKVVNVVLPTMPDSGSPFDYTIDPERLISDSGAAKYAEGTVFPTENDTGVYFLTGTKTYANKSKVLQAINKSTCNITLTVSVQAVATTGSPSPDIALATSSTVATTGTPNLYLGLTVGTTTKVLKTDAQEVKMVLEGKAANFEVVVKETDGVKSYAYEPKSDATWKAAEIQMEGAVSNLAIESTTTAPKVKVTWAYAESQSSETVSSDAVDVAEGSGGSGGSGGSSGPTLSNATASAESGVNYAANFTKGTALICKFTGLGEGKTLKAVTYGAGAATATVTSASVALTGDKMGFKIDGTMWAGKNSGDVMYVKVTDSGNTAYVIKITVQ